MTNKLLKKSASWQKLVDARMPPVTFAPKWKSTWTIKDLNGERQVYRTIFSAKDVYVGTAELLSLRTRKNAEDGSMLFYITKRRAITPYCLANGVFPESFTRSKNEVVWTSRKGQVQKDAEDAAIRIVREAVELELEKEMAEKAEKTESETGKEVPLYLSPPSGKEAITSLMTKEHEPLIIRKYTQFGFPLYISLICGENLNDLDDVVLTFVEEHDDLLKSGKIQDKRNLCGMLTEHLVKNYGRKTEGVAVIWYMDKMMVNSMFGDFMNHTACRLELFSLLNMMTNV